MNKACYQNKLNENIYVYQDFPTALFYKQSMKFYNHNEVSQKRLTKQPPSLKQKQHKQLF